MHVATLSVIHIGCCTMTLFFLLGMSVVELLEKTLIRTRVDQGKSVEL